MRRPVVAVFGRNDATAAELDAARRYGAAIARFGAILATGGVGSAAPDVKEQAIQGAIAVGGSWIGVENSDVAAPPRLVDRNLVLSPGVGHRRNFLLACLCDAAVALPGGHGTASELLFALALGRPVAAVGRPPWGPQRLSASARLRVPPMDPPLTPLDRAIAAAYDTVPDLPAPAYDRLDASEDDIVSGLLNRGAG